MRHRVQKLIALAITVAAVAGCGRSETRWLVAYVSQDQVYAEPILAQFTRETGIAVRAVYDSEAVKTSGLVNRLLAERQHPQCDLFWNNESLRTQQLVERGLVASNGWRSVGFRSRRIIINTKHLRRGEEPRHVADLTNSIYRGRIAIAYPVFGTTATHFLALRQHWGHDAWIAWCRGLRANRPLMVDGNSVVVKLVGTGEASLGLTDSDDVAAGQREGMPVEALPLSDELLLIPNTIALLDRAPHPLEARQLFDFLQRKEVIETLIAAHALEGLNDSAVASPTLTVDLRKMVLELNAAIGALQEIFLR